jgi:hypothetical protein
MALTVEQEKELKQLKTINSPVPSQKKRILKLQQLKKIKRTEIPKKPKIVPITNKYSLGKKGKPFVEKPKDDNKSFVRGLRSRVRKDQLAKTPNKPTAANDELGGPLKVKKKKPLFKLKPDRKTTTKQRMDKVDARLKVKQKEREQKLASSFPLGTGETIERKKDTRKSPGHPSNRAKAPVAAKKVKPVVKTEVVKEKDKLKPTVKPFKAPKGRDLEEINKNVKADPRITAKLKAKPKSKITAAEQKAADSFSQGTGKTLPKFFNSAGFKKEIKESGGAKNFLPDTFVGKLGRLGMTGDTSVDNLMARTVAKRLQEKADKASDLEIPSGIEMTKEDTKLLADIKGYLKKKKGGMVKRNMGGPAKPRKKTVFRRGGGQALRGFGKATYSNKMY